MLNKLYFSFLFIVFFTNTVLCQISYTTETIKDNIQFEPAWTTTVGKYTAWMQSNTGTNLVHVYDGSSITTIPSITNLNGPSLFYMTESYIAYSSEDVNGDCLGNTVYFLETGQSVSMPCMEVIGSNSKHVITTGNSSYAFEIYGSDYMPIFQMPFNYQGYSLTTVGSKVSYWKDIVFFSNGGDVYRYNVTADQLDRIYQSSNIIQFGGHTNDETLAFLVSENFVDPDLIYFNGTTTELVQQNTNVIAERALSFQNKVYWQTSDDAVLRYDAAFGIIDTLQNGNVSYYSLTTSDCYVMWGIADFNNNSSTLFLHNGISTSTISFQGYIIDNWITELDNQSITFVMFDTSVSRYSIKKINFDTPCCTDEDIVTNNQNDHISNTFIHSTSTLNERSSILYQAEQTIELRSGFDVVSPVKFHALIDECLLYNEN